MKHRIPIIALALLMAAYLFAEATTDNPTTEPSTEQRIEELIKQRQCAENLRKLSEAFRQYANNDTNFYPTLPTPVTKPATRVVGPSDVLRISVLNLLMDGLETVFERQVSKDGYIDLLLSRKIKVEGLTKNQVRDAIAKAYASAKILSNPSVKVKFVRPVGMPGPLLLKALAAQPATQPASRPTTTTSAPTVDPAVMAILKRLEDRENFISDMDFRASSDFKIRMPCEDKGPKNTTATQPATQPASRPTTTTSAPAVDPAVMAILKRLEVAGEKYPNITADIDFKVDMLQTGDTESRTGKVYYQGPTEKTPAKFRIHFDTLRQGDGPKIKDVVDYAFDGAWLTVRKERIKQMSRYQVAKPGEKVNPLQLGKGPFPVPFGQKADTVIKHFRPATRLVAKTDPKDTDYIKLTTRRQYRKAFSVVWMEMWVDRVSGLPVKIVTEDRSENITTVIFKNTKTPKSFDKKIFSLPRPPSGWEYHVEKFKGKVKP